ncbi:GGDEF domain-containing protein [Rhabdochromatium marinum]|uniref:GGDEF domain-containing protein n=1 Tax=Rhabdochromatium marinum TaxID=48729 RepID=UPI001907EE6A|nr:diguanylate cyclase [Rhabdochromatium marinum]
MPNTSIDNAEEVLERIRVRLAQSAVSIGEGKQFRVTASFGLVAFEPKYQYLDELIKLADRALYFAKAGGRNRVCRASLAQRSNLRCDPTPSA